MLTFRLTIDTDGDAFKAHVAAYDETERNIETARILRNIADRLDAGESFDKYQTLCDVNGNDCGRAAFKPTTEGR